MAGSNLAVSSSSHNETRECMAMAGITSQAQSAYVDEDGAHPESDELAGSQQSQGRAAKSISGRQQAAHPALAQGTALENLFDAPVPIPATAHSASTTARQSALILDEHAPYRPDALELSQQERQHFQDLQYRTKGGERLLSTHAPVRGGAHKPSARKSHKQGSVSVSSTVSAVASIATTSRALSPATTSTQHLHPASGSPRRHSNPPVPQTRASTSHLLPSPRSKSADTAASMQLQDSLPLPSSSSATQSLSVPSKRKKTPNPDTDIIESEDKATAGKAREKSRVVVEVNAQHFEHPGKADVQEGSQAATRRDNRSRSPVPPALRLSDIQDEEEQEPQAGSTEGFLDLVDYQATQNAIEGRVAPQAAQSRSERAREPVLSSSSPQGPSEERRREHQSTLDASTSIKPASPVNELPSSETTPPPGKTRKTNVSTARPGEEDQVFPRLAEEDDGSDEDHEEEGADSEAYIAATLTASQHRVRASQVGQKLAPRQESTPPARSAEERQPGTPHENQAPETMAETTRTRSASQTLLPASAREQREPHATEGHPDAEKSMRSPDDSSALLPSSQRPKKQKILANPGSGWVKPATRPGKVDARERVLTSSSETESDDDGTSRHREDDEQLPPPLQMRQVGAEPRSLRGQAKMQFKTTQTAYEKPSAPLRKSGKASHASPRRTAMQKAAQKASQARVAFAASPDGSAKGARTKRSSTTPADGKAARRSSRRSGGAPTLKTHETFPLRDFKECIRRGKEIITYDGHVAYVGYDTIWLTEGQEFAETQDALADASGAYENTWQIIVYCRNCPKPPGRYMPASDVQGEEREEPDGLTEDGLRDWRYFEKKRRQGYPESSCAAKIVFELRLNTKTYSKSTWVLRSRADHCMECISNESNVGLGQADYESAREDYYATAEAQWESKVETLLEITKSFKKPPVINDSGYDFASNSLLADIEEAEEHSEARRKKSTSSSSSTLSSVPRQPSGDLGDDEEDAPRASTPKGRKRKRPDDPLPDLLDVSRRTSTPIGPDSVVGEDEQDVEKEKPEFEEEGQMDDYHGANFDHLMNHLESQPREDPGPEYDPGDIRDFPIQHDARSSAPPEPTPRTKRQKLAKAAAPAHIPSSPPPPPPPPAKRSDRLSKKGAAVSPKNGRPLAGRDAARSTTSRIKKDTRPRPSDRLELEPGTLLSDLELDESVQTLLDALRLKTLADLRAATRGNSCVFFQQDLDVPVEDLLLFASNQQAMQAYHSEHKWEKLDKEETVHVDNLDYDGGEELRDKPHHTRRLVAILRNAKVLTRAMQAIDWTAKA